jgi:predicted DNA-binding transcriptional regulator AlpA
MNDDPVPVEPLVLKLREVCDLLQVSPSTIRRMIADDRFPAPLPNLHRWSRISVYAWLAVQRRLPPVLKKRQAKAQLKKKKR